MTMSDLQTEIFTKVLPKMQSLTQLNFDDPEQPVVEEPVKITNNERIFEWVKEHPASYAKDICNAFAGKIDYNSVQSQVHALSDRGVLQKAECSSTGKLMYSVAVDAYPRTGRMKSIAIMQAAREKLGKEEMARRISEGHKANKQAEAEAKLESKKRKIVLVKRRVDTPEPAVAVTPVDLNTLSIVQARKLYDELKQIFGA